MPLYYVVYVHVPRRTNENLLRFQYEYTEEHYVSVEEAHHLYRSYINEYNRDGEKAVLILAVETDEDTLRTREQEDEWGSFDENSDFMTEFYELSEQRFINDKVTLIRANPLGAEWYEESLADAGR